MSRRELIVIVAAGAAWCGVLMATWSVGRIGVAATIGGAAPFVVVAGVFVARVRPGRNAAALVLIAGIACVAGASATLLRSAADASSPVRAVAERGDTASAVVEVRGDPQPRRDGTGVARPDADVIVRLQVSALRVDRRWQSVHAPVVVLAPTSWREVPAGAHVRATVAWSPASSRDVVAFGRVRSAPTVIAPPGAISAAANRVRSGLRAAAAPVHGDGARLMPALVLGDESAVPEAVTDDLRRAGLGHLSAVSGANVAIVLLTALLVARWCGVRGSPLMVTGLGAVAFFAIVARAEPSVLRASVMAVVVLLSASRGGRAGAVPSLAATVLILLLIDPSLATSIGFVLSTVATAGLVVLAPHLFGASVKVERESWPARARRATRDALRVTLAAQLAVAPVLIAMSGRLDLGGVVANLLAAPAVPFATVVGLASGGLSFVHPVLATAAATVAAWPAEWIVLVGERVAASPWARLPWPDGPVGAGVFVLLAAVVATWVRWRRHPRRAASSLPRPPGRPLALALVMTALASTVLVGAPVDAHRRWPPAGWRVVMCDVGQGDATVLDLGGGAAILVDAGPDGRQIDRCLRDLGVVFLPLIVLTHFHADHIAGLRGAVRGRKVGTVLTTDLAEPRAGADDVQVVVRERSLPVVVARAGRSAAVGPWRLRVLAPSRADDSEGSAANNASVVLRADHPDLSVLLLGDVERSAQEQLLRVASAAVTDVDVVKVAHHGSASQVPALMTIAHPRIALIGVGCDNTYGHPTATVLKLLASTHSTVGRTDRSGDLAVTSTADGRVELMARGAAPTLGPASRCL